MDAVTINVCDEPDVLTVGSITETENVPAFVRALEGTVASTSFEDTYWVARSLSGIAYLSARFDIADGAGGLWATVGSAYRALRSSRHGWDFPLRRRPEAGKDFRCALQAVCGV